MKGGRDRERRTEGIERVGGGLVIIDVATLIAVAALVEGGEEGASENTGE